MRFLAKVVPWPSGDEQFVNIHTLDPSGGSQGMPGRAYTKLDQELMDYITWQAPTKNVYVCMSTQRGAKAPKADKRGRMVRNATRSGSAAVELKSLWIDLDAKGADQNSYDSIPAAAAALKEFVKAVGLPTPTVIVNSGNGMHVHWTLDTPLPVDEWKPLASALTAAADKHGLKFDHISTDAARVLRLPGTSNHKTNPPKPVTLVYMADHDIAVDDMAKALEPYKVSNGHSLDHEDAPAVLSCRPSIKGTGEFTAGVEQRDLMPQGELRSCLDVIPNTKLDWNWWNKIGMTIYAATQGEVYGLEEWERWSAKNPHANGKDNCADRWEAYHSSPPTRVSSGSLVHQAREATGDPTWLPQAAAPRGVTAQVTPAVTAEPITFADPWSEFVGPTFPLHVLPAPLANFVEAEHQAMGADPSALAMAALAAIAGALHANTFVRMGDGWDEPPIIWTALVGPPSAMKSPILQKVTAPLRKIDHQRDVLWRQLYGAWKQAKAAGANGSPPPAKPGRLIIQDATPEKVAEILSRDPAGSLLVHDELAGWFGSFERYSSGTASRAFYLSCWNGGPFLKDRVGQGARDEHAEIRVDNLALCALGGIQPDRLAAIRDLTSDGLLQRFLPVLMRAPERGDETRLVTVAEADYAKLIDIVQGASPRRYDFAPDAVAVRTRVLDRLFELEQLDGFPPSVIGAIGKLRGYSGRLALTLHVAEKASMGAQTLASSPIISRAVAEAVEQLLFDFLLPHIFGLYDVLENGGKDRDTVRAIASFILATDKDRLRPSDITAGVRKLRGEPQNKVAEWASRFCAMGWLRPENDTLPVPSAWVIVPGLKQHFADRREQARAARAQAHAILTAGGTRR